MFDPNFVFPPGVLSELFPPSRLHKAILADLINLLRYCFRAYNTGFFTSTSAPMENLTIEVLFSFNAGRNLSFNAGRNLCTLSFFSLYKFSDIHVLDDIYFC